MPRRMSGCFFGPYVLSYDPPVDCDITVVTRASDGGAPTAWVYRNNLQFDVTGEVEELGEVMIETYTYSTDCHGNVIAEHHYPDLYKRWRFKLDGAEPGEPLWVNWVGTGTVQPATGACPGELPMPVPSCTGYQGCYGGDDFPVDEVHEDRGPGYPFSCNGGGSSSALLGVVVLLTAKRKRRSR